MGLLSNLGIGLEEDIRRWCGGVWLTHYRIEDYKIYAHELVLKGLDIEEFPYEFAECNIIVIEDCNIKSLKNPPTTNN